MEEQPQVESYEPSVQIEQDKKAMIQALRNSLGIVTTAIQQVNISRTTHYNWLKTDPEYKRLVEEVNEEMLDLGESKLFEQVKNGDMTAIIFFLKTKGRIRGYIEKKIYEVEGLEQIEQNRQLLAKLAGLAGLDDNSESSEATS